MKYDPDNHHRRSIRLREYYYSLPGAYFVTICTLGRECLFGGVVDGVMQLSEAGAIVKNVWNGLSERFPTVALDEYVVMPNHFHGIVVNHENVVSDVVGAIHGNGMTDGVGAIHELPLRQQRRSMLIPKIIGYFKMNTAKRINIIRDNPGCPVWQRNYYERVIRDERELDAARTYIVENPIKWDLDKENPVNTPRPTDIASS